jgi:hypothetical protein
VTAGPPEVVVGLLADPGLPGELARRLADELPDVLNEQVDGGVTWRVETLYDPFEVTASDRDRVLAKARRWTRGTNWDIAVALTDAPIRTDDGVLVAELDIDDRVALCSLPALGGIRLRRRVRDAVVALVDEVAAGIGGPSPDGGHPAVRSGAFASARFTRRPSPDDQDLNITLLLGRFGRSRLLAGLVRANRPWRLALGLSTALAAAATGSAFGVLYSTVWTLAAALSSWRLAAVTVGAVAVFSVWLVAGHDLWERRRGPLVRLQNTATALTVLSGAVLFHLALLAINGIAALLVIPPGYLGEVLGEPVGWSHYLRVTLMSSALGMIAGAVGSGLEDDTTVRSAAYSQREQERRRLLGE